MGSACIAAIVYMGIKRSLAIWEKKKNILSVHEWFFWFSPSFCMMGTGEGGGRNTWLFPSPLDEGEGLSSPLYFHLKRKGKPLFKMSSLFVYIVEVSKGVGGQTISLPNCY